MTDKQSAIYGLEHFFFDLDGTIADSKADVIGSIGQAYRQLGFDYDSSKLRIGPLLPDIVATISPQLTPEERARAVQTFRAVYAAGKYRNTVLFPGVKEFLEILAARGKRLYIATNKPKKPTLEVLDKLGIKDLFFYIGTPDCTGEHLTKSEVLKMVVSMFDLKPENCLMSGDTVFDIEAGRSAGMWTMAFGGGYGDEAFATCPSDYRIASWQELLQD